MLLSSNGILCAWASGFSCRLLHTPRLEEDLVADITDLKHKYWYMNIPHYGIMATPVQLYTPHDLQFARILNGFVTGMSCTLDPPPHFGMLD